MALPSPTARAALKDKRTELRGYRGWVRPHSGGAIQRRMTLGWGTVIRGSHQGQSPFIPAPLHNLNPLACTLHVGPVDILGEAVLLLHRAAARGELNQSQSQPFAVFFPEDLRLNSILQTQICWTSAIWVCCLPPQRRYDCDIRWSQYLLRTVSWELQTCSAVLAIQALRCVLHYNANHSQ